MSLTVAPQVFSASGPRPARVQGHIQAASRPGCARMIAVLILLPPSEGKAPAGDGPAVDPAALAFPAYRCSGGVTLPKAGPVAKLWLTVLTPALAPAVASGLVVDLRSSLYAGMWKAPASAAERTVTVRVLHERIVDGVPKRSVVS